MKRHFINPRDFDLKGKKQDLMGGKSERNAQIIREIFEGKQGAKRDVVILNSAAALYIAGKVSTIQEGFILAQKAIDSGGAKRTLTQVINFGSYDRIV